MGIPQRMLAPDEQVVLALRPHVKVLAGPVAVALVVGVLAGLIAWVVPDGGAQVWLRLAVFAVAALVALKWVVWPLLVWWNTVYGVTTRRLVVRRGVFARSGHDMPLTRLNDVSFSHNFFERLLRCGTLVVESAGERGQVELRDVPQVERVQRTLYRLADDARASTAGRAEHPQADVDPELDADLDPDAGPDPRADPGDQIERGDRR